MADGGVQRHGGLTTVAGIGDAAGCRSGSEAEQGGEAQWLIDGKGRQAWNASGIQSAILPCNAFRKFFGWKGLGLLSSCSMPPWGGYRKIFTWHVVPSHGQSSQESLMRIDARLTEW
jgi:hypothetical protein